MLLIFCRDRALIIDLPAQQLARLGTTECSSNGLPRSGELLLSSARHRGLRSVDANHVRRSTDAGHRFLPRRRGNHGHRVCRPGDVVAATPRAAARAVADADAERGIFAYDFGLPATSGNPSPRDSRSQVEAQESCLARYWRGWLSPVPVDMPFRRRSWLIERVESILLL